MARLGKGCPKLEIVDLSSCAEVTDEGVAAIGDGCPGLKTIDLGSCGKVTMSAIKKLKAALPDCKVTHKPSVPTRIQGGRRV